jgi:hypothetical protein
LAVRSVDLCSRNSKAPAGAGPVVRRKSLGGSRSSGTRRAHDPDRGRYDRGAVEVANFGTRVHGQSVMHGGASAQALDAALRKDSRLKVTGSRSELVMCHGASQLTFVDQYAKYRRQDGQFK